MSATYSMAAGTDGYTSVELHKITGVKVRELGPGEWRKPIHGVSVLVASNGSVLGTVRTLGVLLPKKLRRYVLRVTGVTFVRVVPLIGPDPIRSDIAPYATMLAAQKAGTALVKQLIESAASCT